MKAIAAALCLLVGMCAVSGNGITLGVTYTEPETGATVSLTTSK